MTSASRRMPSWSLIIGCVLIALALGTGIAGLADWSHITTVTSAGLVFLLWPRRIFRPDVNRTAPDEVVIRFAPWYEGFVYAAILASPVLGATIAARELGSDGQFSAKKLIAAMILISISPVIPWGCSRLRRGCFLRITPDTLHSSSMMLRWMPATQRATRPLPDRTFTRDEIEDVRAWTAPQPPIERRWVGLVFQPTPGGQMLRREVGGSQLTVEPDNLLHALQVWKDADPGELPTQLMDRVEAILRGRPGSGVDHQHWGLRSGSGGRGFIGAIMFLGDAAVGARYGSRYEKAASDR